MSKEPKYFPKKTYKWQQLCEKGLSITIHQGDDNPHHNKRSPHT